MDAPEPVAANGAELLAYIEESKATRERIAREMGWTDPAETPVNPAP